MLRKALLFALLAFVQFAHAQVIKAEQHELPKIKAAMEDVLKDAESARIKDVYFVPEEKGSVMCGLVNAKNGYGAYPGYTPFYGMRFDREDGNHVYFVLDVGKTSEKMCKKSLEKVKKAPSLS